ncbi:Nif3-like dinuclear metal center hexameric protein [Spirosoma soli]|uniref:Nif3-like dinuclear metal center hexameric protein n=1 Tax=Spirosoma soli TaxID=1770529 RepID=A0ABW5LZR0_9BACT
MPHQPSTLDEIAAFLQKEFATERYPNNEQGGIYKATNRSIQRLGLALEPFPGIEEWVEQSAIDALWLHRPWQLDLDTWPSDVGVLYHHLPFDETLAMGFSPRMATALGALDQLQPLEGKQATNESGELLPQRPIGMLFNGDEQEFDGWLHLVKTMFGGYDRAEAGRSLVNSRTGISRLAVVGAMNDSLIREAADRGAELYITGQYRKQAQEAVDETGIAVIAVGHRRSEEWGLGALAELLRERWPALTVADTADFRITT